MSGLISRQMSLPALMSSSRAFLVNKGTTWSSDIVNSRPLT
ncbi:hypothetical protein AHiyo8_02330 [Arthrobacter sp. Hiyo8]|nr:hypothetical protein AHiyo8_02330 [Arthrobacter sp. Hiyo8]